MNLIGYLVIFAVKASALISNLRAIYVIRKNDFEQIEQPVTFSTTMTNIAFLEIKSTKTGYRLSAMQFCNSIALYPRHRAETGHCHRAKKNRVKSVIFLFMLER